MNDTPKRKGGIIGERRDARRERVAELHAQGWTLAAVANELGCSTATVSDLLRESRGRRPTSATAKDSDT